MKIRIVYNAFISLSLALFVFCFNGCRKSGDDISLPKVITAPVKSITETTAISGGEITDDGGSAIIFKGVCWSKDPQPTISGPFTRDGTGVSAFSSNMTNLLPGTTYYVRAYATNGKGTGYGEEKSFTTLEQSEETSSFFPIGVWLQNPTRAAAYRENGINVYIGLWNELNQTQLDALRNAHMKVICRQNAFGLNNLNDTIIYAWMHDDEPDNAQWNEQKQTYDPCINPALIIADYDEMKQNDPSRPVYLNLGQGVAYINYVGRGACSRDTNSYKVSHNGYLKGCDIGCFDIYPVNSPYAAVKDNLWYVPQGVTNLLRWSDHSKPIWAIIECTHINESSSGRPSPSQVKSEVWMALIHGATGIGYFCHSWYPTFVEAGLLNDPEMIAAVKIINEQIASLGSVLNSKNISDYATVNSSNGNVPVAMMAKYYKGFHYIFAVAMRDGSTTATFNISSGSEVEVIGEARNINISNGSFSDSFSNWGVHLYKIHP